LCLLPAFAVIVVFLLYGSEFFALFGISKDDGFMLSTFAMASTSMAFVVLWQRFVLRVSFPPSSQAFLHPQNVTKHWEMKALIIIYALSAVLVPFGYLNDPSAFIVSISTILASLYSFVIEFEILFHMAKDKQVWHPFTRYDD
jgi:cobalamin synthase